MSLACGGRCLLKELTIDSTTLMPWRLAKTSSKLFCTQYSIGRTQHLIFENDSELMSIDLQARNMADIQQAQHVATYNTQQRLRTRAK